MLAPDSTVLVVIDVQGRLARIMWERERLFRSLRTLIAGVRLFGIPIIWLEQTPDKLGPTVPEVAELLADLRPLPKCTFSCWGEPAFRERLEATGRRQVLLCGIETHVCVYQTAADLLARGYQPEVVTDAVSSRCEHNWRIGLEKIRAAGAALTSVETVLFELQREAGGERFRRLVELVK